MASSQALVLYEDNTTNDRPVRRWRTSRDEVNVELGKFAHTVSEITPYEEEILIKVD